MAKVSVIVPIYNTEKYLKKCLDSLVNQTLQDIEIIMIDDGSTDNSRHIAETYVEKYPEIAKLIHKTNGGQGTARNIGIKECSGEYIGFVDSDDYVELEMYEKMWQIAKEQDLDLVECDYLYIREETGENLKKYGYVREYKSQKDMFLNPLVSPWNKLFRASIIKQNNIEFPEGVIYEDTAFFIKCIANIKKWRLINKPYVYHMLRGSSTMNINKSKRIADIFVVLQDVIMYYKTNALYETYSLELEYFCVKILLCSSMGRIAEIPDRKMKKEFMNRTFEMIDQNFKEFRKNPYFGAGMKNLYMRTCNRYSIKFYSMFMKALK